MAVSDPLIFESVTIADVGGGNATTYELTDSDNIEITHEGEKLTVDNAQEILSGLTGGMTVPCFDLSAKADSHVLSDSDVDPATDKAQITLDGGAGSSSVRIDDVFVIGILKFDRPSPYVELSVQSKGASEQVSIV